MIITSLWRRSGLLILVLGAVGVLLLGLFVAPLIVAGQEQSTVDRSRGNAAAIHVESAAVLNAVPSKMEIEPGVGAEFQVHVTNTYTGNVTVTLDSLLLNQVYFDWRLVPTIHVSVLPDGLVTSTLWVTPSLTPLVTAGISTTVWLTASLDYTTTQYTDVVTTVAAPKYGLRLSVMPSEATVYPGSVCRLHGDGHKHRQPWRFVPDRRCRQHGGL